MERSGTATRSPFAAPSAYSTPVAPGSLSTSHSRVFSLRVSGGGGANGSGGAAGGQGGSVTAAAGPSPVPSSPGIFSIRGASLVQLPPTNASPSTPALSLPPTTAATAAFTLSPSPSGSILVRSGGGGSGLSFTARGSASSAHLASAKTLPPPGTHSITPVPNYAPSYPSPALFQVAQALPQPPPRASTARVESSVRRRSPRRDAWPEEGASAKKPLFVFRSGGRAAKVTEWLSEEQKEAFVQTWQAPTPPAAALQPRSRHSNATAFSQTAPLPSGGRASIILTARGGPSGGGLLPPIASAEPASEDGPCRATPPTARSFVFAPPRARPVNVIIVRDATPTTTVETKDESQEDGDPSNKADLEPHDEEDEVEDPEAQAAEAARLAAEEAEREAARLAAEAEQARLEFERTERARELQARCAADDDTFVAEWTRRDQAARPLLLSYLSFPRVLNTLFSTPPAHGFRMVGDETVEGFCAELPTLLAQQQASASSTTTRRVPPPPTTAAGIALQTRSLIARDFGHVVGACEESALVALWVLEKWRLALAPPPAFGLLAAQRLARSRTPVAFTDITALTTALKQSRADMTRQQRQWLEYLKSEGREASEDALLARLARDQHLPDSTPLPPPHAIFTTATTRARVALRPHMDALWIEGAGRTAFSLVRRIVADPDAAEEVLEHEATTTTTVSVEAQSASDSPASPPQFDTFSSFLEVVRAQLASAKVRVREALSTTTSDLVPFLTDSVLASLTTTTAAAARTAEPDRVETRAATTTIASSEREAAPSGEETSEAVPAAESGTSTVDALVQVASGAEVETVPIEVPTSETVSSGLEEREVGTGASASSDDLNLLVVLDIKVDDEGEAALTVDFTPLQAAIVGHHEHAEAEDATSSQATTLPQAPTAAAGDAENNDNAPFFAPVVVASESADIVVVLRHADGPANADDASVAEGEIESAVDVSITRASDDAEDGVKVSIDLHAAAPVQDLVVVVLDLVDKDLATTNDNNDDITATATVAVATVPAVVATEAESRAAAASGSIVDVTEAPTVSDDATPLDTTDGTKIDVEPEVEVTAPSPESVVAPEVSSSLGVDVVSYLLHQAGGVVAALCYLRALSSERDLHAAPLVDSVPVLLSGVRQRRRDFLSHRDALIGWFAHHGHELIRSLNHEYASALAAAAASVETSTTSGTTPRPSPKDASHTNLASVATAAHRLVIEAARSRASSPQPHGGSGSTTTGGGGHDLLTCAQVSALYWQCDAGSQTLRHIVHLFESKKRFTTLADVVKRLKKVVDLNRTDYLLQRSIVRDYLASDAAALFRSPDHAHSPLTFGVDPKDHVDLFLVKCMLPTRTLGGGGGGGLMGSPPTPAPPTTPAPPSARSANHAHHRSASTSLPMFTLNSMTTTPGGAAGGAAAADRFVIPANWSRSSLAHASGASIVRHLEYIIRQRRQQTIQEYRVKLDGGGSGGGSTGSSGGGSGSSGSGSLLYGEVESAGRSSSDKVIQPLLFHDIHALIDYVATLAFKAKQTIEATYRFVASASSSLLVAREDATYGPGSFSNPRNLVDFAQTGPSWTVHDARALFDECAAGHDLAEYAQRVSDAKLVHLHRSLDQVQGRKWSMASGSTNKNNAATTTGATNTVGGLPPHPLSVPCDGEPLAGLRGCSFHFPDRVAFARTLNTLYAYDLADEVARHAALEEQVRADQVKRSQPKSKHDILLAWLQRDENTLLTPTSPASGSNSGSSTSASRAELVRSLTLVDMDRLMAESGGGEKTLEVLQGLQRDGRTYASLNMLIGAAAYALHPEPPPKEPSRVAHEEVMVLLNLLARTDTVTGPAVFSNRMMESGKSNVGTTSTEALNPLDLDAAALVAAGDPIAPHLYGVALQEVATLIGAAFGVEPLLDLLRGLLTGSSSSSSSANTSTSGTSGASTTPFTHKFHSFADLKAQVLAELRRRNPYRPWVAPPAIIVYDGPAPAFSATSSASSSSSSQTTSTSTTSSSYENRGAKDVYDFLFNTSHTGVGPMLSASSTTLRECRLLPSSQVKIPVQKGDAALLLRYAFCEEMIRVCEEEERSSDAPAADSEGHNGDESNGGVGNGSVGSGTNTRSLASSSKRALFLLHSLNDPTPSFKSFACLPEVVTALRAAKAATRDDLMRGVEEIGPGAREVYSFLRTSGGGPSFAGSLASALEAPLPGARERELASGVAPKERLEVSAELLASIVAAGGELVGEGVMSREGSTSSSAVAPRTAPPPALTILSHLSLLGEEFSRGQGEELVSAIKAQKAAAENVRRALADNIKLMALEEQATTDDGTGAGGGGAQTTTSDGGGDSGVVGVARRVTSAPRVRLLTVVPEKVGAARDTLVTAIEDTHPRLNDLRPLLHTQLPSALAAIADAETKLDQAFREWRDDLEAYRTAAAAAGDEVDAASNKVRASCATFLSVARDLFVSLPTHTRRVTALFASLPPVHTSVHAVYAAYYPLFFFLPHYLVPTPQPFFRDLLTPLSEAVEFLARLRNDTAALLATQQSLAYVLERVDNAFVEMRRVIDEVTGLSSGTDAAAPPLAARPDAPLFSLASQLRETCACFGALAPFVASLASTNEHYLPFLVDLVPFFEGQLRPLLPTVLPLLIPVAAAAAAAAASSSSPAPSNAPSPPPPASPSPPPVDDDLGVPSSSSSSVAGDDVAPTVAPTAATSPSAAAAGATKPRGGGTPSVSRNGSVKSRVSGGATPVPPTDRQPSIGRPRSTSTTAAAAAAAAKTPSAPGRRANAPASPAPRAPLNKPTRMS